MVTPDPTPVRMVCGDPPGVHTPGCPLAAAETAALHAVIKAAPDDGHPLIVALVAVANAGLLRDVSDEIRNECLLGVLDYLYDVGLIAPAVTR